MQPLSGLLVLDFSTLLPGPLASLMLAEAGAEVIMPLADAFWGDRYGQVRDPYGHIWAIATHKEDLTMEERHQAMEQQRDELEQWAEDNDIPLEYLHIGFGGHGHHGGPGMMK